MEDIFINYKINNIKKFFGNSVVIDNDNDTILNIDHIIDENNVIIITNNIMHWEYKTYMLVLGKNKIIYVKQKQVLLIKDLVHNTKTYAVKVNGEYFKPYQTNFDFKTYPDKQLDTFSDVFDLALTQDKRQTPFKILKYGY